MHNQHRRRIRIGATNDPIESKVIIDYRIYTVASTNRDALRGFVRWRLHVRIPIIFSAGERKRGRERVQVDGHGKRAWHLGGTTVPFPARPSLAAR